jgi:hypothetical protein
VGVIAYRPLFAGLQARTGALSRSPQLNPSSKGRFPRGR